MGPCGYTPRGARTRPCWREHAGRPSLLLAVAVGARQLQVRPAGREPGWAALRNRGALRPPSAPLFQGGYFHHIPGALPRAPSPHGAEHAQVKTARLGTWTCPPSRLREAPRKFKAAAAPPPGPIPIRRQGCLSEPQHLPLRPSKFISPGVPPPIRLLGLCIHSPCPFSGGPPRHRRLVLPASSQHRWGWGVPGDSVVKNLPANAENPR